MFSLCVLGINLCYTILSASAGAAPDLHSLCVAYKLLAEIGVGDGDYSLGTFPGGCALEADNTVFGDQKMHVGACVGDDTARVQSGQDAAVLYSLAVGDCG